MMTTRKIAWTLAIAFALACEPKLTDAEIERSVAQRLESDASLSSHPIEVTSLAGEVWLMGSDPTHGHRVRATSVAERVRGVDFVNNHLDLAPPPRRQPVSDASEPLGRPGQPMLIGGPDS